MYDCIKDLVALEGCETTDTVRTLNEIGMSEQTLNDFLDDSYQTVDDLVDAMKDLAAANMVQDIVTKVGKNTRTRSVLETNKVGFLKDESTISASNYVGAMFDFQRYTDFLSFRITKIGLYLETTGDVDVEIYNLLTGENLGTYQISAVANQPTYMDVDFEFSMNQQRTQIGIVYDSTGITAKSTPAKENGCAQCGMKNYYSYGHYANFGGVQIAAPFVKSNATNKSNTYGLLIDYTVSCDFASWVCTIKDLLALPYLYKIGETILDFGMNSAGQFSQQKVINRDGNIDRLERFKYNYENQMKSVLRTMIVPETMCFQCNTLTEVVSRLPG